MDINAILRNRLAAFLGWSHEGKRDLYSQFGYERDIRSEDLWGLYARGDIATRIVKAFPQATWRDAPVIRDEAGDSSEKGTKSYSPFVEAVEDFWEANSIAQYLERADRLSGVGKFGLLVAGFRDGKMSSAPLENVKAPLLYLSPYGDLNASINSFDADEQSPRFGKPLTYTVKSGDLFQGKAAPAKSYLVHHSRVLHLAEFLESDDVYGTPRLLCVANRLRDLEKVVGGAAETFWQAANRGLALWADKEAVLSDDAIADMKKQAEEFQHQLSRYLVGTGMTAQELGGLSPDPEMIATVLLDLIAGAVGIPKRILLGTERGELSSAQDENNWSARIDERRRNFATPFILRPFVNLLIRTGNLPAPKGKWWVEWPENASISKLDEANVAAARSTALANYARTPGAEFIVPPQEFRTDFLGLTPESEYAVPNEALLPDIPEPGFDEFGQPVEDEELGNADRPSTFAARGAFYVYRPVLNARHLLDWAHSQGIKNLVPPGDLHCTVMHAPHGPAENVALDEQFLSAHPGAGRTVGVLGAEGAFVLFFEHAHLNARHAAFRQAGAKWKFAAYRPHITLSYNAGVNPRNVTPYGGLIALGREEQAP